MNRAGFIKFYRKTMENDIIASDPDRLALWIWLLTEATYKPKRSILGGEPIMLEPGQLTLGRKQLSEWSGVDESKVQRALKMFEKAGLIEQQTTSRNRLISIVGWDEMSGSEQQSNTPEEEKKREVVINVKKGVSGYEQNNSRHYQSTASRISRPNGTGKPKTRGTKNQSSGMSIIR